ncbi:MAG: DUF4926 domain-containing protein [Sedimentibacter sp.]|uniref:DUF4926 domain-containing protein n=1 Tax=Sedimentibacter sp. TaxID=1960295 RepID=UPI003158BEDE
MLKEYDVVRAKSDLNPLIPRGTKGAVMLILHENPNRYEVEFVDENGETLELLTVGDDDLELVEN